MRGSLLHGRKAVKTKTKEITARLKILLNF
jgi:hypothetical protein